MSEKDEYYGQATVSTNYGQMVIATTKDIWLPGLSCGARGVALLLAGADHDPSLAELAELTGESQRQIDAWMKELEGTGYLEVED
jgi:hypothetical protein